MKTKGVALVTGAGRRIGRTIALALGRDGWAVGVHYGSARDEAAEVVAEIAAQGGRAEAFAADLADADQAADLVGACGAALGPVTCLINNASLFAEDKVGAIDAATFDRHMAINLRAPVLLAQAMAAQLPVGVAGNVINIIDQRVLRPSPDFFSYAVSKDGLFAATRMLAQALAPRIRVNGIGPGPVLKSIYQSEETFAAEVSETLLGKAVAPEEISEAVRFILSQPSLTGQMMAIDGGQHLFLPVGGAGAVAAPGAMPSAVMAGDIQAHATDKMRPPRRVIVDGLEVMASVGIFEVERRYEQRIVVSATLDVLDDYDGVSDRLDAVYDYSLVVDICRRLVDGAHFSLIETLAERIAEAVLGDARVQFVRVRIEKPDIVAGCRAVGIAIERRRGQ